MKGRGHNMSKYTTEVRFICEQVSGLKESQGYDKIDEIIMNSREAIFDFDYPLFDDAYKPVLEKKILKHYYTREIGCETVGLWKHFLNLKMNEIMPYYNKLYESELIEFNPMHNFMYDKSHEGELGGSASENASGTVTDNITENRDLTRNVDEETDTTRNTDEDNDVTRTVTETNGTTGTGTSMDKYSDTPQGAVTNLLNDTYLTNARAVNTTNQATETKSLSESVGETKDLDESINQTKDYDEVVNDDKTTARTGRTTNTGTKTFTNTDEYLEHLEGNNGAKSFSELLIEFRKTFLNIDMMVINELNDLFMGVW